VNEDRAARYHRLRRRTSVAGTIAGAAWLVALLATGASAALATRVQAVGASLSWPIARPLSLAVFITVLALGWELVSLPFVFYRSFLLERKYGLSSEPLSTWVGDHLKALGLGLLLTIAAGLSVYGAIRVSGNFWWALSAGIFAGAGVLLSRIAPVLLMPLFYRFRPLDRETLRERLLTLSRRAGVPVLGAFEWGLGDKTTRANAALVGVGHTRRILVSDTLLRDYTDDEIEVILAHEMAHHIHHDMWTALALEAAIVAVALLGAHLAVTRLGAAAGVAGPADLAALPALILAAGLVSLVLTPLGNAWSRYNERRADRFALTLTRRPGAFISAMRRLGQQNLAEERPSTAVLWFFHTHPTIDERIAAAEEFTAA
jgi:Zn-dependent protease with chaperone function